MIFFSDNFYSFVFKGLLTEEALDKAGRKEKHLYDEDVAKDLSKRLGIDSLDLDFVSRARKMSIVYVAICAFENTVRAFVSKTLLEEEGEDWWKKCVPEGIKTLADNRQKEEQKIRYQSSRGDSLIDYVQFGDLMSIMQKTENWAFFEPYVENVQWGRGIMDILEKSRNVIMHSGELSEKDIERVGMNIRDWINQVGA